MASMGLPVEFSARKRARRDAPAKPKVAVQVQPRSGLWIVRSGQGATVAPPPTKRQHREVGQAEDEFDEELDAEEEDDDEEDDGEDDEIDEEDEGDEDFYVEYEGEEDEEVDDEDLDADGFDMVEADAPPTVERTVVSSTFVSASSLSSASALGGSAEEDEMSGTDDDLEGPLPLFRPPEFEAAAVIVRRKHTRFDDEGDENAALSMEHEVDVAAAGRDEGAHFF